MASSYTEIKDLDSALYINRRNDFTCFLLIVGILSCIGAIAPVCATEWSVSYIAGGGNYSEISDISAIGDGDIIRIWGAESHAYEGGISVASPNVIIKQWEGSPERPLITDTLHDDPAIIIKADNVTLQGLNISGNSLSGGADGAGVHAFGSAGSPLDTLTIEDCCFTGNRVDVSGGYGGGFYASYVNDILVKNTDFINNTAERGGGCCFVEAGGASITNTPFTGNTADLGGGCFFAASVNVTVTGASYTDNTAHNNGGGCYFESSDHASVTGVSYINNTGLYGGGCEFRLSDFASVTDSSYTGNAASSEGGGCKIIDSANISITNTPFTGNTASSEGGGCHFESSPNPSITGSSFTNNIVISDGGGCYFMTSVNPSVTSTSYTDNSADVGAGCYFRDSGAVMITGSSYTGNEADSDGGGCYFENSDEALITGTSFTNNIGSDGGGCYIIDCDGVSIIDSPYTNNTGHNGGGCHFYRTGNLSITTSPFINNTGYTGGGCNFYQANNLIITGSSFINNTGTNGGGCRFLQSANATVTGTSFDNNTATGNQVTDGGGGCYFTDSDEPVITGASFTNNNAANGGGGCYFTDSDEPGITGTSFTNNTANYGGGCYVIRSPDASVTNTSYIENTAGLYGGGCRFLQSDDAVFTDDSANQNSPSDFSGWTDSTGITFTNLTLGEEQTRVSFTYGGAMDISGTIGAIPDNPSGYMDINHYVRVKGPDWILLNVSYDDADVVVVNQSSLTMWNYYGSTWSEVPGTNGVNTVEKYVYANLTGLSDWNVIAPLASGEVTVPVNLSAGWNMISVPVANATIIVPTEAGQIYRYNGNVYESVPDLESVSPGEGFWIAATGPCTLTFTGTVLDSYTEPVTSGWNMIGSCTEAVPFAGHMVFDPAGALNGQIYTYDPAGGVYVIPSSSTPGCGYWASVTTVCILHFG